MFERNKRFAVILPAPSLGDDETPIDEVRRRISGGKANRMYGNACFGSIGDVRVLTWSVNETVITTVVGDHITCMFFGGARPSSGAVMNPPVVPHRVPSNL